MTAQRLPVGGQIDRNRPLGFRFDGRRYLGFAGDTLASALLANGVNVVGRSFKYHRARGLLSAGVEEPNALVRLESGARTRVNLRATEIELYEGLSAWPVNCWPNVRMDIGAVNGVFSRFLPAGFYYKTFMWPTWRAFEGLIRRAAGLGRPSPDPDPDRYESAYMHCDVLVIGAGPAGIAAALAASRAGARVVMCEQEVEFGGSLLFEPYTIDGKCGRQWLQEALAELRSAPETIIKSRTTAVGYFDHNAVVLVERSGHCGSMGLPAQRLWQVRASRVILATGALERPLVYPGNDRPGIMLSSAVRHYLHRFGVRAGEHTLIFTNNDSAYATAGALLDSGGAVVAVVDSRKDLSQAVLKFVSDRNIRLLTGAIVVGTAGAHGVRRVRVRPQTGRTRDFEVDLVAMSGGFDPAVHLFSQSGGKLEWDDMQAHFRPNSSVQQESSVGACAGLFDLPEALAQAFRKGSAAVGASNDPRRAQCGSPQAAPVIFESLNIAPQWHVDPSGKAFVDFQNDVTVADIALAARENYASVEHLKRYTTLGMAPDQGKTSNVNGLAILGAFTGRQPSDTGTTRFRFPYTPISMGVLAGRARSGLYSPIHRLPCHSAHERSGAVFEDFGEWQRPAHYLCKGETPSMAQAREVRAVRQAVGLFEGSSLGKIIVKGPDAAKFLDRIYANAMSTLKVGHLRYGMMLNELGNIIDDGVTGRLHDQEFWVGTSSAGASRIAMWLEQWLQCEWRDYGVITAPVTFQWAVLTLAGPCARSVLLDADVDFSVTSTDFPHMTFRDGVLSGIPVRVMRVSYTGELSFEINVESKRAEELWQLLMAVGARYGIAPVGIDAWDLLRTEKGYVHIGSDTDGTTSPVDVGWKQVLKRDADFLGKRSLMRPDNVRADRLQFVGFESLKGTPLAIGAHVIGTSGAVSSDGYVTSAGFSETLDRWVALGMLRGGGSRKGDVVQILTRGGVAEARVVAPCFYDPQGQRLNA